MTGARAARWAAVVLLATATLGWRVAGGHGGRDIPLALRGVMLGAPAKPGRVRLVDHRGQPTTSEALFAGRWSFLFLGFASCPNVCPLTLTQLAAVKKSLAREFPGTPQPRYVFASVDPQRDTPARLAAYLGAFDPDFIGVTGDPGQLAALSDALTAFHRLSTLSASGDYGVVHSGEIYLLDPAGRVVGRFTPPLDPDVIAQQLVAMIAYQATVGRGG